VETITADVNAVEAPKPPEKNQKYWRQLDLMSPEKLNEWSFVVVGAGSVGSWTALALAKMGAQKITVWDRDVVDEHNVSCQVYQSYAVGKRKVEVLAGIVQDLTDQQVVGIVQHLDKDARPTFDDQTILVMAVDNMDARKHLWEVAKACPAIRLVIDVRMGGEVLRMYAVNPHDPMHEAFYEENLYSSEEGEHLPCTAQAVSYSSFFSAAFIASTVSSFVNGVPFRNETTFHCRQHKLIGSQV
jgi:molybdopterin/thiamine biosynthesis adenylyltransferase